MAGRMCERAGESVARSSAAARPAIRLGSDGRSAGPEQFTVNYKKALDALNSASTPRSLIGTPRTINGDVRISQSGTEINRVSKSSLRSGSSLNLHEDRQELTFPLNRRWDIAKENDRLMKRLMEIKTKTNNRAPWKQPHVISRHYIDSHTTSTKANMKKKNNLKETKSDIALAHWEF